MCRNIDELVELMNEYRIIKAELAFFDKEKRITATEYKKFTHERWRHDLEQYLLLWLGNGDAIIFRQIDADWSGQASHWHYDSKTQTILDY